MLIEGKDHREALMGLVSGVSSIEVPDPGDYLLRVGGYGWLTSLKTVSVSKSRTEVDIAVKPSAYLHGYIRSQGDGAPIREYNQRIEYRLPSAEFAESTYIAMPEHKQDFDGRICVLPTQDGFSMRLELSAPGLSSFETEWLPIGHGESYDLGAIALAPIDLVHIRIRARTEDLVPVEGVYVQAVPGLVEESWLRVQDNRVSYDAPDSDDDFSSPEMSAKTNTDGACSIAIPDGQTIRLLAWKQGYRPALTEAFVARVGIAHDVVLARGCAVAGEVYCDPGRVTSMSSVFVELHGAMGTRILSLAPAEVMPFYVDGLSSSEYEFWVVTKEISGSGKPMRNLVASETFSLIDCPELFLPVDIGAGLLGGSIHGVVIAPADVEFASMRAFSVAYGPHRVAHRTVSIKDGAFTIPDIQGDRCYIGIECINDDGSQQAWWYAEVEVGKSLVVNLSETQVVGTLRAVEGLLFDEILVTPAGPRAGGLPSIIASGIPVYPGPKHGFSLFGLPSGVYNAVAQYSHQRATFVVPESGTITVDLAE